MSQGASYLPITLSEITSRRYTMLFEEHTHMNVINYWLEKIAADSIGMYENC